MRLFGWDINFSKASAPIEAARPRPSSDLVERDVPADPYSDWWLGLPAKVEPKLVDQILRTALSGNIWQQSVLTQKMLDSWPTFRKCAHELRSAISSAKFVVHPFCETDKEPTQSAKDKAALVQRCLDNFKPDRFADEDGFVGLKYDLCDAILNGISVVELLWDTSARDGKGARERRPRASCWVNPRHITFDQAGRLALCAADPINTLQYNAFGAENQYLPLNPSKYLVAKFKSKSGSCLGAGFMRVLAQYWVQVVYGRDFLLGFAQDFGAPFRDIAYQAGIPQSEVDKFEALARKRASNKWCVHPNSGTVTTEPPQSLGGNNPIVEMMRMADEACMLLMLGQTLTSTTPTLGGTRAQGEVHQDKEAVKVENLCDWIATILTEQLAESILLENYGETSERPHIEADLTRPLSTSEKVQVIAGVSNSTIPLPIEPVYKMLDFAVPNAGDKVLVRGAHTIMEEAITPTEQREQQFEEQIQQQEIANELLGGGEPVEAALREMDEAQLKALEADIAAAEQSPKLNGEWDAVQARLNTPAATPANHR